MNNDVTYLAFDDGQQHVQTSAGPIGFYNILSLLRDVSERDAGDGRHPDNYRYLRGSALAYALGIKEASLRKQISRLNKVAPGLVENKPWTGYRLNPHRAWVVHIDEIGVLER